MRNLRLAVVGHVEHVTLGRAAGVPRPGDIVHLREARMLAGGGGGLAFAQLARSDAEVHLFSAFGGDDAGEAVLDRVSSAAGRPVYVHAARRPVPHPRVVVWVDALGRRTVIVTADPLQPAASDALGWPELARFDGVYFTGSDPESLRSCRAARCLVATARRASAIAAAAVAPDVIVGSVDDPRENAPFESYDPPPAALVLTDGPRAIRVARSSGVALVEPPPARSPAQPPARPPAEGEHGGDYGAGDSFAAALTYFVAAGLPLEECCLRAARHGAAVLRGIDPTTSQLAIDPCGDSAGAGGPPRAGFLEG